jgi:hypothetical protein
MKDLKNIEGKNNMNKNYKVLTFIGLVLLIPVLESIHWNNKASKKAHAVEVSNRPPIKVSGSISMGSNSIILGSTSIPVVIHDATNIVVYQRNGVIHIVKNKSE